MSELFPWEPHDPADVVPVEERLAAEPPAAGSPQVPGVDVVWPPADVAG